MVVALIFVTSFFGMVFGSVILIIGTQKVTRKFPEIFFFFFILWILINYREIQT